MALNLSKEQRAELEAMLAMAEPYDKDDPEINTFDGKFDYDRWKAMMAKRFLEQDDREKAQQVGE